MVDFKDIHIIGYASIVNKTIFKLNQEGLNIIRGKVGSGKTTIPSALTWCLFGKSLKDKSSVNTWEEIKPEGYQGTMVQTTFDIPGNHTYRIIRCSNYKGKIKISDEEKSIKGGNNIFIFADGQLVTHARNKPDQQKLINQVLGYSYNLFKSSIIFGQKMKRIIEESGPDKKKVFEEAFEVSFVEEAKTITKDKYDKNYKAYRDLGNDLDNTEEKLEAKEGILEDQLIIEKDHKKIRKVKLLGINKKLTKRYGILDEIEKIGEVSFEDIKPLTDKLKKKRNKHEKVKQDNRLIDSLNQSKLELQGGLLELDNIGINTCNECGQKLKGKALQTFKENKENTRAGIQRQIDEIDSQLKPLKKIDETDNLSKLNDFETKFRKASDKVRKKIEKVKSKKQVKKKIKKLEKELEKVKSKKVEKKSPKLIKSLNKLKKHKEWLEDERTKLNKTIKIQKWLIDDPLSNNGLKVYLFNSYLEQVNQRLHTYSNTLGFQVEFGIDLESHRKDFYQVIYKDDIIIPYTDLSGGQKQLVDTSIAFAIHDVVSNIRPTNLLFLDEPFESLGMDEVEIIEELVEDKAKDKCLFLITHHLGFNPLNANDIHVKQDKHGFTKIK